MGGISSNFSVDEGINQDIAIRLRVSEDPVRVTSSKKAGLSKHQSLLWRLNRLNPHYSSVKMSATIRFHFHPTLRAGI